MYMLRSTSTRNSSKLFPRRARSCLYSTTPRGDVDQAGGKQKPTAANSTTDVHQVWDKVRTWTSAKKGEGLQHAAALQTLAGERFSQLGGRLNRVTGYDEIELLKQRVVDNETSIRSARQAARDAKSIYETAVSAHLTSQRQVNNHLSRKSSWLDDDFSQFAVLMRQDQQCEHAEVLAKQAVKDAEGEVERQFDDLLRSILARYHEEQVWSDKIRKASTYGSLAVLGVNVAVFIFAILVVEPWKRRRLVESFEKRVMELNTRQFGVIQSGLRDMAERMEGQERVFMVERERKIDLTVDEEERTVDATTSPMSRLESAVRQLLDKQPVWFPVAVGSATGVVGWIIGRYI